MCKKLSVFCLLLAVVATASAGDITSANPLQVNINGGGTARPLSLWSSWDLPFSFSGPQTTTIPNGGAPSSWPTLEFQYRDINGGGGGSRDRSPQVNFAHVGKPNNFGNGAGGFGRNYVQLKLTNLVAGKEYKFFVWSFEQDNSWVVDPNNYARKYGVWSTINPNDWCMTHGMSGLNGEPNGYGPKGGYAGYPIPPGTSDSNMPATMQAAAYVHGGRTWMQSPAATSGNPAWTIGDEHYTTFKVTADAGKTITLYGWIDATDWGGSMHMPLNGVIVVPEPATVALLGLGGLLLRRKRA